MGKSFSCRALVAVPQAPETVRRPQVGPEGRKESNGGRELGVMKEVKILFLLQRVEQVPRW